MAELVQETNEYYRLFVTSPKTGIEKKYTFPTLEKAERIFVKWAIIRGLLVRLEKRIVIDTEIKVKYPNKELV